jgi:hypothetical protein
MRACVCVCLCVCDGESGGKRGGEGEERERGAEVERENKESPGIGGPNASPMQLLYRHYILNFLSVFKYLKTKCSLR